MDNYSRAAELIQNSKYTVMLTGAGISTESGIPDFRSKGTGLWERVDPMEALSTEVLYNQPDKFYKLGFQIIRSMEGAKPNAAHFATAKLEEAGYIRLLVTQNIDNLHFEAGSKNVLEVHGHTRSFTCLLCKSKYSTKKVAESVDKGNIPPRCSCGSIVRPDVILFGDMLPDCFNDAVKEVQGADLLIAVGTSLTVSPVNYLAALSKKLIIINADETPFDYKAKVIIRDKASFALSNIAKLLKIE